MCLNSFLSWLFTGIIFTAVACPCLTASEDPAAGTKAFIQSQFPGKTLQYPNYVSSLYSGDVHIVDILEDDPSVTQRYECTIIKHNGCYGVKKNPLFKFKTSTFKKYKVFCVFEKPEGGFGIIGQNDNKSFHPKIADWEKVDSAQYSDGSSMLFAKAEEHEIPEEMSFFSLFSLKAPPVREKKFTYLLWTSSSGWSQKPMGWSPIKNEEDILRRITACLTEKYEEVSDVNLELLTYNPFGFSTFVRAKIRKGSESIYWVTQNPDGPVEFGYSEFAEQGTAFTIGDSIIYWKNSLRYRIQRVHGSGINRFMHTLSHPHYHPNFEWYDCSQKAASESLLLKGKKSDSEIFEYWLYNYKQQSWKQLSDAERDFSWEEYKEDIKAKCPKFNAEMHSILGDKCLVSLIDPKCVHKEQLVILTRDREKSGYKLKRLLVAKADSIDISGNIIKYRDLDGNTQLKHFSITDEDESINDVLPPHETIKNWDQVEFSGDNLLFAKHIENYGRDIQYWTLKEGKWHLLCAGKNFQQELRYIKGNVYKSSYNNSGLTIELLNSETLVFEPTNVANMPTSVVSGRFIPAKQDSKTIIAVQKYNSGIEGWTLLREDSGRSTQLENIINKLQSKWRAEFKPYADVSLSIRDLIFDSDDQLYGIRYFSYQDDTFSGRACLLGDDLSVEWEESFDEASFSMHPALQLQSVDISGHDVPYYFVAPGMQNGKTIVLMEGGPHLYYTGDFAKMINSYAKQGYSIIIPQESLRTGYGWKHFEKGLGEMGRGNLHQLLRVFYDAAEKGFIPDLQQVSLYGHSYGGFVAASFALRWDELHKEASIQKGFNFTSIVADGAWVDHELSNALFSRLVLPDDALTNPESYINRVMPTHRTAERLLTSFFMIHGISDTRCSADHTRGFFTKLSNAGRDVPLFWHKGDHNPPEHKSYPKFVKALMESADTAALEKLIGLERERPSQDQAGCVIS